MRILIVEDQQEKKDELCHVLQDICGRDANITHISSLHGAIKEIARGTSYQLVILDMSMPNYSLEDEIISPDMSEGYAGKELLYQMMMRNKKYPTIVVTQYVSFKKGAISLSDLDTEFSREFHDFYLGYVYYNYAVDEWKTSLGNFVKPLLRSDN